MNRVVIAAVILLGISPCQATAGPSSPTWLAQIGGKGAEVVAAVTETSDRRICATGTFWVNTTFGHGDHTVILTSDQANDIFLACYETDGTLAFARSFEAARGDEPRALAALPGGDVVITGHVAGGFGAEAKAGGYRSADLFISRIDPQGRDVWTRQLGGRLADTGNALAITADGEILVAGNFADVMTYPAGGKVPKLVSAGARDGMVLKLTADGDIVWARRFGGPGDDEATAVGARRDGGVLIAGTFRDDLTVGDQTVTSRGYRDVYLISLDANGETQWFRHMGGAQQDTVHGLTQDSRGRVHLAGNFQSTMHFDEDTALNSAGSTDVFVARYDAAGTLQFAASFGGALTDQVFGLAITREDGLLLSGHYQGDTDLAPGPTVARQSAATPSNSSGYLLRLDAEGEYQSATALGGAGMEMALGLVALNDGGVAVAGLFNKDLSIAHLPALDNRGKTDVFVLRLSRQGPRKLSLGRSPDIVKFGW